MPKRGRKSVDGRKRARGRKKSQAVRRKDPTIAGQSVGTEGVSVLADLDSEPDVVSDSDAESAYSPLADRRLSEEHGCSQFAAACVAPSIAVLSLKQDSSALPASDSFAENVSDTSSTSVGSSHSSRGDS